MDKAKDWFIVLVCCLVTGAAVVGFSGYKQDACQCEDGGCNCAEDMEKLHKEIKHLHVHLKQISEHMHIGQPVGAENPFGDEGPK